MKATAASKANQPSKLAKEFGLNNDFSYMQDFKRPRTHARKAHELKVRLSNKFVH
jgi:hypothetical protein